MHIKDLGNRKCCTFKDNNITKKKKQKQKAI